MSYHKFFVKYGLQDIHWVGHSIMNTVDAVAFHKRKAIKEGGDDHSENYEMEIIAEGELDKALMVP